jgi:hypothetical protein
MCKQTAYHSFWLCYIFYWLSLSGWHFCFIFVRSGVNISSQRLAIINKDFYDFCQSFQDNGRALPQIRPLVLHILCFLLFTDHPVIQQYMIQLLKWHSISCKYGRVYHLSIQCIIYFKRQQTNCALWSDSVITVPNAWSCLYFFSLQCVAL